ncbi:conserved hypothetical protein [Cronobacter dublinensis 582]|nr:conserved hypothetical protein [Cronobacter dublinensis 582]
MGDTHRRRLLENPAALLANRLGLAEREIQRVNMPTVAVEQRAGVTLARNLPAHRVGVQQLQPRIAVALPVRLLLHQPQILLAVKRHKQPARAIVTLDVVTRNALADDFAALKHHAAEHPRGVGAVARFDNVDIAAVGVHHLAAVTPARAIADARRLQQHHVITLLHQMQRRREPGITAANDTDIALHRFCQRREGRVRVSACGIVAVYMFSHGSAPGSSRWFSVQ